jgi:hypothetical protein
MLSVKKLNPSILPQQAVAGRPLDADGHPSINGKGHPNPFFAFMREMWVAG